MSDSDVVVLDTGPLGMVAHPRKHADIKIWLQRLLQSSTIVAIPEIADYELRRELLRIGATAGISRLNTLKSNLLYLPLTTEAMLKAAASWAELRNQGTKTANDAALDGDVILAAQVAVLAAQGADIVVATTNTKHLSLLVQAREWHQI